MTKDGSTKSVNSMTPGVGVLLLERDHISHIEKMHYFFSTLGYRSDKLSTCIK